MPWGCELRDAGVLHCKHSGSLALGSRSSFHGLAKEIAARDLLAIEGWHAKRWAEPLANPRAHGKGLSRRVGLAPGRGAFARPRHAGPVRSSHPGMDSHRCALPRVLTDSVDNRLPSSLLFAVLVVALPAAAHGEGSPEKAPVRNVVLVHGAWADGSSWAKVIPILEKAGLHVVAVQNPLTSLADDVAAVQRAIALEDGPVILVGHSYGGAVITEAGADPKVAGLVYVAAFAPDAGQGVLDLGKDLPPAPGGADIRPDKGGFLKMTSKGIGEDFAQDLPKADRRILAATQGPTNGAAFGAKVSNA